MIETKDNIMYSGEVARDFWDLPQYVAPTDVFDLERKTPEEESILSEEGDGFWSTTLNVWRQANVQGHSVNLSKKMQEYSDSEGKWLPEIEQARKYLQNKDQIRTLQSQLYQNSQTWSDSQKEAANEQIRQLTVENNALEYGIDGGANPITGLRTLARTNPYLRDIFYDTSYYDTIDKYGDADKNVLNKPGARDVFSLKDRLKVRLYDWLSDTYTDDFNHSNNLSHYISEQGVQTPFGLISGPTQEQLDYLWSLKNNENSLDKQLSDLEDALEVAEAREYSKSSDIAAKINTIKKGNYIFDPTKISPSFKRKYEHYREEGISLSNPESWVYAMPEIGSSYAEIGAMVGSMAASGVLNLAAKAALTASSGGVFPLLYAATEAGVLYGIQEYMRDSETKSEIFDASSARALQQIDENNISLNSIVEQYKPVLKEKGYPVESMTDQEIFNLSLIEPDKLQPQINAGITADKASIFNSIKQEVLDDADQQVIRQTNMALSVPDYLLNLWTFSYGGKYLKKMFGMSAIKQGTNMSGDLAQTAYNRAINTVYDAVPKTGRIAQLQSAGKKLIDKTIIKNFDKIAKNPMTRVSANRTIKGLADMGVKLGLSYFNERNEEGIQNIVSNRYQKGEYDNVQNYTLLNGLAHTFQLGTEANLAYYGLHPDESLNTDKDLKNAMDVGGFTGLFMTGIYSAPSAINLYKQVITDQQLRGLVADRYGDAERDNKVEAFVKAGNENGKNFARIRESLQALKQHKPEGVTDEMIDEDIDLASRVSFWLNNSRFKNIADRMNAKKGSKERTYMLQNLIDLQDRTNEQGKATTKVADQLEELIQELLTGKNKDFDFVLGREYGQYANRKRRVARGKYGKAGKPQEIIELEKLAAETSQLESTIADIQSSGVVSEESNKKIEQYQNKLQAIEARRKELSDRLYSDPISYEEYKRNIVDQIIQVRAYSLLKQLKQEIENRKNDLQKLAREKHLDVNVEGISGIGSYIDQFLKQTKPFIDRLVSDAKKIDPEITEDEFIQKAINERYNSLPKQEEFDNLIVSRAVNAGVYNDLLNHLSAYTEGVYTGDMRLYRKTFNNLTSQEQAEISITPEEYDQRYAENEPQNETDESADQLSIYRKRAERVIERDLTRRQSKVNQAAQEKLEENGTPIDQPVVEPIDEQTVEQQQDDKTEEDQPDTGYNNGQADVSVTAATEEQTEEPAPKSKLEAEIDALEETLGQREQTLEQTILNEEELQEYEPSVPKEQIEEEVINNISDQNSDQDLIRVREESAEVLNDNTEEQRLNSAEEHAQEDREQSAEEEQTPSEANSASMEQEKKEQEAEVKTPVTEVPVDPTSNKAVIPPIEDVPNPLDLQPENDELFVDPSTGQLMYDPTGSHDVQNSYPVDDVSLQVQNEFEAATDEWVVGPSMHQKQTANSDEINPVETSSKQKKRYIASTFFYQPTTTQIMPIQNYGEQVEFTTKDGKLAERGSGKELAENLAQPGWLAGIDDAYYIVTSSTHAMSEQEAIDNLAIHLIIEKDGKVYNTSLRAITPELRKELLGAGMTEEDIETQINKLRTFRNQIIRQYAPQFFQGKGLPSKPLKHVKPVNLRTSNGSLNNQVNAQGLPQFQLLSEVEDFSIPSDPQELTEALLNPDSENGVEIGFGTGPFATNHTPFSIQRLDQQGETSTQGRGYAGKLYYIPKVSRTPSGNRTLPIMLAEELHRIPSARNYTEIQLSINADGTVNKGVMPTTAELIFNLLTGVYNNLPPAVSQFLLDLLANSGPKTSTAGFDAEQSNRFNFLVRKQLLTYENRDSHGTVVKKGLITAEPRQQGLPQYGYKPFITDLMRLTDDSKKRAVWNISQNIHWNTDKDLLMSEFPQEFVDMLINTFTNYKGKKDENTQFPVFSKDLTFSLKDVGYTVKDGKVVKKEGVTPIVGSWYLTHGKIKTDLGKKAFYAPFVYTDGARVDQSTKESETTTPTKTVTTKKETIETRTPQPIQEPQKPVKEGTRKSTIALAATPENLQKYGLEIPSNMKTPIGQAWGIVQGKDGKYKVVLAPKGKVQGFNSTVRGKGSFNKEGALKWLEQTLGITPENTDIIVVNGIASTLSDSRVYGVMRVVADTLSGQLNPQFLFSNDAGKGIEYHEAFHYVTQLLLNKMQRAALYAEYERRHPSDQPRTKREVEELLAEEFRTFMLNESNPSVGYRIVKFFKNIVNYIKTLFGRVNLQDTLFNAIARGEFKDYKLDNKALQEFYDAYGEGLYYYVPGLTKEQVEKMPNITDGNTFYKVVDSLTSTVLTMYNIRNLDDVSKLSIHGIFEQLQERLDQGWIDEVNEPLVEDVISNEDVFKKYILRKLRSLSIRESDTLEDQEDSRLETETGDNPDNNWDKNQGEHSKKKNIAFNAKLFFYSVPQYKWSFVENEDGSITKEAEPLFDDIFGFNIAESFNVVWNKVMNNLWNIDNYQDILTEVARLAKTDATFYALNEMLNDPNNPIDDNTKTQLEVTIKSFNADYLTIEEHGAQANVGYNASNEEAESIRQAADRKSIWEVKNSRNLRRVALYPKQWSNAFFASSAVITDDNGNRYINKDLINFITPLRSSINRFASQFLNKKKKSTIEQQDLELNFQQAKEDFIKICNAISIPFDIASLDRMLDEMTEYKNVTGYEELDKFISFWSQEIGKTKSFQDILSNLVTMSNKKNAALRSRSGSFVRTSDRIFNYTHYEAAINKMARAYGQVHPTQQESSVVGADGSLMYSISENNYANDQIRNINQHKNGKIEQILKTPYSKRSLIANAAKNGAKFKLNSFLMLRSRGDKGRDYFGISPIEDYVSKLVLTFNDFMTLPTMSDKKTWYAIEGLSLVKDVLSSSSRAVATSFAQDTVDTEVQTVERRFSDSTLNIFANMFLDEFDAVWDYYLHKDYVAKHPKERIDNYHGKISNGVMQAGGNGGRFRYFSSLRFNGIIKNINHELAKIETEDTTEAVLTYLKDLKMLLFGNDNFTTITEVNRNNFIFEAVNNFLVGATNRELRALNKRGIVTLQNGRYKNALIPDNVFSYYSEHLSDRNYNKGQEAQREEDIVYSAIGSHVANTMISIIEFEKCVTGDPAYYKHKTMKVTEQSDIDPSATVTFLVDTGRDVDKIKRLSSVLSTGTNLRTIWDTPEESNRNISVLTLKDNQIGSDYEQQLRSIFRNSLLRDVYSRKHPTIDDDTIIERLSTKEKEDAFYNSLTPDEKKYVDTNTENSVAPYTFEKDEKGNNDYTKGGAINQSDAAVYIRPAMYRRIMKALGNWSPEIEEAYKIMEGDDESWMSDPKQYIKVTAALAQPLKMVYFGDHFRQATNLNVPIFDKMAMFPLFKALAKADNRLLYDRMNNEELGTIDMIAFESAVKVGGTSKFQAYTDSNNETFDVRGLNKPSYNKTGREDSLPVYNQDISNLRLQLNTEPHEATDRAFGTQAVKICLANLNDDRTYGINKDNPIKGKYLKTQVMEAINALTEHGRIMVFKRFFRDHQINNKALSEYLISQAVDSNMPESFIEGLGLDQNGEFIIPLEATSNRRWVESRLISYIGKTVVDLNTKGGAAIQMSSFGFKSTGPRKYSSGEFNMFNNGNKLKFLRKDGSMEVMLSTNFFRHIVPKEFQGSYGQMRKWLLDHNVIGPNAKPMGVGYRIPTQGLSSTFSFVVADVLPDRFGDTVVVPDEFTAMTGSDFDVDKLYIAMLNTDENGNIVQYENNKNVEQQSLEALQNMVIQSYQIAISDNTNMAETRASIDTLTKLLQKEILPKVQPDSKKEALPAYELLPSFQLSRKEEYTSGKAGIGPFALNSTNHALTQFTHLNMVYSQGNPYNLNQLDEVKGRDGHRILDWLSAMINAHVDVAKDPYVITLNVNSVTYNITNLLLRGGMGKSTFYFLAQPSLKELANTILVNKGVYGARKTTEDAELRRIRQQYATLLQNQINDLPDSQQKTLWQHKFNDVINGYSIKGISAYPLVKDDSFISTKYADTFDESKLSKALTDKGSIESLYQQLLVLNAYQTLSVDAKRLSDLVNRSQIDTKKYGNTLATQMNFRNSYDTFISDNDKFFFIKGQKPEDKDSALRKYFRITHLGKKLHWGTILPREILKNQVFASTSGFEDVFTSVMASLFGRKMIEDRDGKPTLAYKHQSDKKKVNAVAQYVSTIIRARIARNIPQLRATDEELRDLFQGSNSMSRRLSGLKSYIREHKDEFPDLIAQDGTFINPLLDYLQEYPADGVNSFIDRVIPVESTMNNDADVDNRLTTAFAELLYHSDELIRIYANDLAKYAYLTSYDERGRNTFFNLVPNQWKQEVGYISAIKNALSEFKGHNNVLAYQMVAEAIDNYNELYFPSIQISIARNMWNDEDIVPTIDFKEQSYNPDTNRTTGEQKSLFYANVTVGKKKVRVTDVFTTPESTNSENIRDFVKVVKNANGTRVVSLYQRVGSVGYLNEDGKPVRMRSVYRRIPKLGITDGNTRILELLKESTEPSAFDINSESFSEYSEEVVEQKAIGSLRDLSKYGLSPYYVSAEASNVGIRISDNLSGINDQNQEGLDVSTQLIDARNSNSEDVITPEQMAKMEAETSDFVNLSITEGIKDIAEDMDDVLSVMNSIDTSQEQVMNASQEQVDIMDMSMFTAEPSQNIPKQKTTQPSTRKTYSGKITRLDENQIFVFGSNTQGRHGKGSALFAKNRFGAKQGQAEGLQGKSYAIITKDLTKRSHPSRTVEQIKEQISKLYDFARQNPDKEFLIAYSGTGTNLNGYSNQEMASMFASHSIPTNIVFEEAFNNLVTQNQTQQSSIQNTIEEVNPTDFQSIEAIDMNELIALGQNRKKQCK